MQQTTPDTLRAILEKVLPDWRERLCAFKKSARLWRQSVIDLLLKVLIFALCTWLGYLVLLSFADSLWFVYINTPAGHRFAESIASANAKAISALLAGSLLNLSATATANALLTALAVGLISRLLLIRRYFFTGRGLINRILWALLVAAAAAANPLAMPVSADFWAAFAAHLIPSACLFAVCFSLAAKLLPELDVSYFAKRLKDHIRIVKLRNRVTSEDDG